MKKIIIKLIELYQNTPLRIHSYCRYYPTCSEYTKQAIIKYGIVKGLILGIKRILNCNPLSKHDYYYPLISKGEKYEKNKITSA